MLNSKYYFMQNWKKLKNFLRLPLTTGEAVSLIKEHMLEVSCSACENIDPKDLKLKEIHSLPKGYDLVIVYYFRNLFWEVSMDRSVRAFSNETAERRYDGESFDFSELCYPEEEDSYCYTIFPLRGDNILKIKGTSPEKLRFQKSKNW